MAHPVVEMGVGSPEEPLCVFQKSYEAHRTLERLGEHTSPRRGRPKDQFQAGILKGQSKHVSLAGSIRCGLTIWLVIDDVGVLSKR